MAEPLGRGFESWGVWALTETLHMKCLSSNWYFQVPVKVQNDILNFTLM